MSGTDPIPVPTPAPVPAPPEGWLPHIAHAIEHGAALVYHEALVISDQVHAWEDGNPELAALAKEGLDYATNLLTRLGLPVAAGVVVVQDIWAALKAMAAKDPTVTSVGNQGSAP